MPRNESDWNGSENIPGESKIDFRLNTSNPNEMVIYQWLRELKTNNRASDFIKACLFERITGRSWVDGRALAVVAGALPPAGDGPAAARQNKEDAFDAADDGLTFDDGGNWSSAVRG